MKELKFNFKYLIHKKELYFSFLILNVINIIHIFLCIIQANTFNAYREIYYSAEYQFILYNPIVSFSVLLMIIIPIINSMNISDSDFLESKRKTVNMLKPRINYRKNIVVRFFLSIIITFLLCFISFLINYISLVIIFGSGNYITYFQEAPFNLLIYKSWFLDSLRLENPVLFIIAINMLVSLMYGLLVSFAYAFSFYVKNRIVIYFIPLCYEIINELLFSLLGLNNLSIVKCLQPFSQIECSAYVFNLLLIIFLSFILIKVHINRKELIT